MLHSKFLGHQPFGSGEEVLLRFLPHLGHLGNVIRTVWTLLFPHLKEAPYEIWFWLTQWILRKRSLKILTQTHTYGRQKPTYPISSPLSLWLSWAKKQIWVSVSWLIILIWPVIKLIARCSVKRAAKFPATYICNCRLKQIPASYICSCRLKQIPGSYICSCRLKQIPGSYICSCRL